MEQKKPHARYDEFADQFTSVLHTHWPSILQIVNRQSPRVATLLRVATPGGLKRTHGTYRSLQNVLYFMRNFINLKIMKLWRRQYDYGRNLQPI